MERSNLIFGNEIPKGVYKKSLKSKKKYEKKYGNDLNADYQPLLRHNEHIGDELSVVDILIPDSKEVNAEAKKNDNATLSFDHDKGLIVGNIRMGFGHYRISMAIASAAKALGYTPYWMDLNSYKQTTCTKVISSQNDLYSLGSRLSSKSKLFNKLVWEPMNYEGFRKLSYNSADQKNAELMAPVFKNIPKDIPVVATHVWPSQAALHAGMENVVNAIPDNWPMALHLSEGALHTVQTHNAYMGYRILNGMDGKKTLKEMPSESLKYVGHYIDHELVSNIEYDCNKRIERKKNNKPIRFLLTIGGAGAQKEIFEAIIRYLLPLVKEKKAALFVNVGDYINVWEGLKEAIKELNDDSLVTTHFDNWDETKEFANELIDGDAFGIHAFYHKNIFEAVYCTNLLMRSQDVLVTKPSELAFYPVPKLFIKRVGKHEMWGAIHSAEIGDGTLECEDIPHTIQMIEMFMKDDQFLIDMCENIKNNNKMGIYNGAYEVVKEAMKMKA